MIFGIIILLNNFVYMLTNNPYFRKFFLFIVTFCHVNVILKYPVFIEKMCFFVTLNLYINVFLTFNLIKKEM